MKRAHTAPAVWLTLAIVIALTSAAGCGPCGETARLQRQMDARPEILFGATPPPLGAEDLGHFASISAPRDGVVPFDLTTVYLRRTIYDTENTRRPHSSGYRTRVYSVEQQLWLDQPR